MSEPVVSTVRQNSMNEAARPHLRTIGRVDKGGRDQTAHAQFGHIAVEHCGSVVFQFQ